MKRTFQEQWPNNFPWLNADNRDAVFCKICREYPSLADTSSSLFAGKKVDRKDTLLSHQLSAKHKVCTLKHELKSVKKVGTLDKAFAKV